MTEQELKKLWQLFHEIEDANQRVLVSNAFVAACFMHEKGEHEAAVKLLKTIFNVIDTHNRNTLVSKVFKFLPGNEALLASQVSANIELKDIMRRSEPE